MARQRQLQRGSSFPTTRSAARAAASGVCQSAVAHALTLALFAVVSTPVAPFSVRLDSAGPAGAPLLAGIIDEAGVLTPVLQFDGVHWRNRWPAPDGTPLDAPLPASLGGLPRAWTGAPLPARWYAWMRGAVRARDVLVSAPVRYQATCLTGVGLQSGLKADTRTPQNMWPKKKLAVALSTADATVAPITEMRVTAAVRSANPALWRAAEDAFRTHAKRAVAGMVNWPPWTPTGAPVRWTRAWHYAPVDSDDRVYLLEGRIGRDDEKLPLTGFLWLRAKAGVAAEHRGHVVLDDEDAKMSTFHHPFGVVRTSGRAFWFSEVERWESESYELIDLMSATFKTVLTAQGGGC